MYQDNTLYKCRRSLEEAQSEIENQSAMIFNWFEINGVKVNPESVTLFSWEIVRLMIILLFRSVMH